MHCGTICACPVFLSLLILSCHHESASHSLFNLSYWVCCLYFLYFSQPALDWALDMVGRVGTLSEQIITLARKGRIGQLEEGWGPFFVSGPCWQMRWFHCTDPRAHWGLRGVRHIWANRLLMSCLYEPLIMALERDVSTRGFEYVLRIYIVWVGTRSWIHPT